MRTSVIAAGKTHTVELGGELRFVGPDDFQRVCDELVSKHGGQPKVTKLGGAAIQPMALPPSMLAALPLAAPVLTSTASFSHEGKARSDAARLEMKMNGFAPQLPVYAAGTRVNEIGVRNAESSRKEYDALPTVQNACASLVHTIGREERRDLVLERLANVRMTAAGNLKMNTEAGMRISEQAFSGFLSRTGIEGHSYLAKCPSALRAVNVNHWMEEMNRSERAREIDATASREKFKPTDVKFRTRLNGDERHIFATVSGSYGSFDADKIAAAISLAAPTDARGSIVYDGTRTKFENLFHSNIVPAEYVAGEFFKAGVLVRTDDTGGGSCRVSAVVWQNLCLNLIILDECEQKIASIRHIGSVEAMADKFRAAFAEALKSIEGFRTKWGYALDEDVQVEHDHAGSDVADLSISKVLPGLFNGIIERELVPVRGQRKQVVGDLVRMFEKDNSAARAGKDYVSRAAVVNAFTRYAHEVNADPFAQDEIERGAGGLLNITRSNRVLPYEPIEI